MTNSKTNSKTNSIYKGHFITTRWVLAGSLDASRPPRFSASFTVDPPDPCRSSWQQFPTAVFGTLLAAVADALAGAMRSIDHDIAMAAG